MEFVIAIALVAFFWYLAYRAWKGRGLYEGTNPALTIIVAHDHRTGLHYQEQFGMRFDSRTKIVTEPYQLYGYGHPTSFIYVNSDNGKPDPKIIEHLRMLESQGCHVDWFGFVDE